MNFHLISVRRSWMVVSTLLLLIGFVASLGSTPTVAEQGFAQDARPTPLPRTAAPITPCPTTPAPTPPPPPTATPAPTSPTATPTTFEPTPTATLTVILLPATGNPFSSALGVLAFIACLGACGWGILSGGRARGSKH
ncbi:MAG TPA: hypothetical protein PKH77_16985 [Anaerolineae bacterium]|nr:hypothetical protein [Anaerolineae bacterium]